MSNGALLPVTRWQVFNGSTPAAGALLYSYLSGSSTPQFLYADKALGTPLTNPVQADQNGVFPVMYMAAVSYRITISSSTGATIFPATDDVYDFGQVQILAGSNTFTNTAGQIFNGPLDITAATAGQIKFPTSPNLNAGAHVLDAYAEGTWTPVIGGSGGTTGQSYTRQVGLYTRVGNLVHVQANVLLSNKGTITGNVQVQGLPFASIATSNNFCKLNLEWFNMNTAYVAMSSEIAANDTAATIFAATAAATSLANIGTADVTNTTSFILAGTYLVPSS